MAKSIRSKRKRMLRNIKRERYAVKELKRLKTMLGIKDEPENENESNKSPVLEFVAPGHEPKEAVTKKEELGEPDKTTNIYFDAECGLVVDVSDSSDDDGEEEEEEEKAKKPSGKNEVEMDHSQKRVFNKNTMRDQFGNYPVWFSRRDIKKRQIKDKILKKKLKKKEKLEIRSGRVKKTNRRIIKRQKMWKKKQRNRMEITITE